MSEVTLISSYKHPLKPLVKAALENELKLIEAGIQRTRSRLDEFEAKYHYTTDEFIRKFENDELTDRCALLA